MDKKSTMEALVREAHEKGVFTGTWLYAENGRVVSKGAVGRRDAEDSLPMREDSLFDLASVSKNFTAAAVMLLRRRGLLDLEDGITRFFPEIPFKGVTVRNLLNHTGGLPDYMEWVERFAKEKNVIPGNEIIVPFLCECGEAPSFTPGEQFEYSNTGYCLLAQLVTKVSGVPFEDFLLENVFRPAGMASTRVIHRRKDRVAVENLAYGLVEEDGRFLLPDEAKGNDSCVVPLDGMNGDGLVHSNVFDLLAWDRALRAEKVLTGEEQALMYTPGKLLNGEDAGCGDEYDAIGYGFGWDVFRDDALGLGVGHSGGWPGYSLWYERLIDADRVLILLCCRDSLDERGADSFRAAMRALAWDREPEPLRCIEDLTLKDPDKSGWDALCGTYAWRDYRVEVSLEDGNLRAAFLAEEEGDCFDAKLYPLGDKTFGIKTESSDLVFSEDGMRFYEIEGKKL